MKMGLFWLALLFAAPASYAQGGERPFHALPVSGKIREGVGEFGAPRRGGGSFHHGVDIQTERNAPIRAPSDGVVSLGGLNGSLRSGYGYVVVLDHLDDRFTLYAHMAGPLTLQEGSVVREGDPLGRVGATGNAACLPPEARDHLHLELIRAPSGLLLSPWGNLVSLFFSRPLLALKHLGTRAYGQEEGGVVDPVPFFPHLEK